MGDLTADFNSIKLHLDNLMGGGNFGEAINNLLNALGGYIWDQLKASSFLFLTMFSQRFSMMVVQLLHSGLDPRRKLLSAEIGRVSSDGEVNLSTIWEMNLVTQCNLV